MFLPFARASGSCHRFHPTVLVYTAGGGNPEKRWPPLGKRG